MKTFASPIHQAIPTSRRGGVGLPAGEHRYSRFAALVGLTGWTGTNFANESTWLDDYTDSQLTPRGPGAAQMPVITNRDSHLFIDFPGGEG